MITEDFVSFETAKLLKKRGFDEPTLWFYVGDGTKYKAHKTQNEDWYRRPTIQMAMKWLREVHNIFIEIGYDPHEFENAPYFSLITNMHTNDYFKGHNLPDEKPTYEQSCEAAIKYCLENLI